MQHGKQDKMFYIITAGAGGSTDSATQSYLLDTYMSDRTGPTTRAPLCSGANDKKNVSNGSSMIMRKAVESLRRLCELQ